MEHKKPFHARDRAINLYADEFESGPTRLVRSPGRINIIGDHVDYEGGLVLPMAIDLATYLAFTPRADQRMRMRSEGQSPADFLLGHLPEPKGRWSDYVAGVAQFVGDGRVGFDGAIASDLPARAGLSSSAALTMAAAAALCSAGSRDWSPREAAEAARRAENEYVGVQTGPMDQLTVGLGAEGHALLIDCESLDVEPVSVPDEAIFVIIDTQTPRSLVGSEYDDRRLQCRTASRLLNVELLSHASLTQIESHVLDGHPVERRRARHVISETARVGEAVEALHQRELTRVGELMVSSHESLRDDFEVSSRELDAAVESAIESPSCHGARMTGAGFGGSAIALVDRDATKEFMDSVRDSFYNRTRRHAVLYPVLPSQGLQISDT